MGAEMSAYEVNKLCRRALREPEFRAALQDDPATALERLDLTPGERAALLAGAVGDLYRMGASAFLLSYLPRWNLFGLDVDSYGQRMRAAG
jgi:Aromatic-ring-opening dioxygenase LigAB, LigA subunit